MASPNDDSGAMEGGSEVTDLQERHILSPAKETAHSYSRWHKYVKPRVGQMFQAKVPKLRASSRASSLSLQSLEEASESERLSSAGVSIVVSPQRPQSSGGRRGRPSRSREAAVRLNETLGVKTAHQLAAAASQHIIPERGGLCVHRPPTDGASLEKEDFLVFARNVIMQTPAWNSPEALASVDRHWKEEVETKFGGPAFRRSSSNISTGSGRKRGRKRKIPDSDDEIWGNAASSSEKEDDESSKLSSSEMVQHTEAPAAVMALAVVAGTETEGKLSSLEEDEYMLAYLQSKHQGNCDVAKFSVLSDLSMGRAVQARRHLKKRRKLEEMETPLSDMFYPSESWRRRYERLCSTMLGDVQNRHGGTAKYSYIFCNGFKEKAPQHTLTVSGENCSSVQSSSDNQFLDHGEELKQTWRSVLECAEDIVERAKGRGAVKAKPKLRDLLILLRKAHTLLRPEEIFGKRDTTVKRISQCMNLIVDLVVTARNFLARLVDMVYDEKDEGVELDVMQKSVEYTESASPVTIEETEILRKMFNEASQWEKRLDHVLRPDHSDSSSLSESFDRNNILAAAEQFVSEAKVLSLRPRSLVSLEKRIEKAHLLRNRIRQMKESAMREKNENKKLIAALVREANRLDLVFPELTMLTEVHEAAQEWTDRAAVAVRSRISLAELEELVERGDTMPVNLSDLLEKLRSRVSQAHGWIDQLKEMLNIAIDDSPDMDETKWLANIRNVLNGEDNERVAGLQDLSVEGSRIPVDITELQLLQIEIDARNWSMKAKKLSEKKGKIDDLREHLLRGAAIRDKVPLGSDQKTEWILESEAHLEAVVKRSDAWFRTYRPYLEGDNRRADGRCRISLALLRQIVEEGNKINANLGNALVKMNRILTQAEIWFKEHENLLARFGIILNDDSSPTPLLSSKEIPVKMDAVNAALESASELSVDLDEAMQLRKLAEKSQEWFSRALTIAPKRSKRNARGKKKVNREKHSLDELLSLVQEASTIPIDIAEDLERLQMQLNDVQSWRLQAQCELRAIATSFSSLRKERFAYYGEPDAYMDSPSEDRRATVTESEDSSSQSPLKALKGSDGIHVHRMVGNLLKSVQSIGIYTAEEKTAELLGKVSKWCTRAAIIIATPAQVFEKRYFRELDNFIAEGEKLLQENSSGEATEGGQLDDAALMAELTTSWVSVVSDDKTRLEKCCKRRDEFIAWCEKTETVLSSADKKIPIETLRDLGNQSLIYPRGADTVKKLQALLQEADAWIETTGAIMKSGQKMTLEDAKNRVAKGEELNVSCPEFRNLRNALRVARGWQLRVKRSKLDTGQVQISDIKYLIEEHNSFLVCMPDEIKKLKEALQGYCLCRKPYEGFMVGCDTCEEWFHGPCIGVSESQAERYDKYVCVRCVISKLYKGCAESTVQAIRKWTNSKDLTKARQIDGQRHQRKVREKRREIEKLKTEIQALKMQLCQQGGETATDSNVEVMVEPNSLASASISASLSGGTAICQQVGSHGDALPFNAGQEHAVDTPVSTNTPPGTFMNRGETKLKEEETADSGVDLCLTAAEKSSNRESSSGTQEEASSAQESDTKSSSDLNEIREKLNKAVTTLENCNHRMDQLAEIYNKRKALEAREDAMNESLRKWCILVRATVLVPTTEGQAKHSRPRRDGGLSSPMDYAVIEATKLGIRNLPDVSLVINAFGCMSWCLRALHLLARKPKIDEIRSLVSQSEGVSFKLPETKCVRMLQSPLSRATLWQAKVAKALKPIPGEKKPFEVELLAALMQGARDIPYSMVEESQLWNTIEDDGNRHCICGGPSDGRFMISCDKCEQWFHGDCVKIDKTLGAAQSKWICPLCTGKISSATLQSQGKTETLNETRAGFNDGKDLELVFEEDISPYAPKADDLWPPFGLLQSTEALAALGVSEPSECEEVSDTVTAVPESHPVVLSQAVDSPASGTAQGPQARQLIEERERVPQSRQLIEKRERVPQARQLIEKREQAPQARQLIQGREQVPQAMQLIQGREQVPQAMQLIQEREQKKVPQAMQLIQEREQAPQAMQLIQEGEQAPQAMQLIQEREQAPQAMQLIQEREHAPQAMQLIQEREHAPQAMQLIREREQVPQARQLIREREQVPQARQLIREREQMPQARQLIQERSFLSPQPSSVLVSRSYPAEGTNLQPNGYAGLSINSGHPVRPHQTAGNNAPAQQNISRASMPMDVHVTGASSRPERVGGLYPSATMIPVVNQGSETQKPLVSTASVVPNMTYSIDKR